MLMDVAFAGCEERARSSSWATMWSTTVCATIANHGQFAQTTISLGALTCWHAGLLALQQSSSLCTGMFVRRRV